MKPKQSEQGLAGGFQGAGFAGAFSGMLGGLTTTPGLANNLIDVIQKVVVMS